VVVKAIGAVARHHLMRDLRVTAPLFELAHGIAVPFEAEPGQAAKGMGRPAH